MVLLRTWTQLTLTSLLAGLVLVVTIFLFNLLASGRSFVGRLIKCEKFLLVLLFVLFLLPLLAFSLIQDVWLSFEFYVLYARELFISAAIVLSFQLSKILFNRLAPALRREQGIERQTAVASEHSADAPSVLELSMGISLNDALVAWDEDLISEATVQKIQALESLEKWIWRGEEVGWYEIYEEVNSQKVAPLGGAHLLIERELWYMQQYPRTDSSVRNEQYKRRLQTLAQSFNVPSLDEALQAWEQDQVSDETVQEIQMLELLEKWIRDEEETGWYELHEMINPRNKLQYPGVHSAVRRELWRLDQDKARGRVVRNGQYEQRLRSLLAVQEV